MRLVFDSSALIAYVRAEAGGDAAGMLLAEPAAERIIHAVNLCEVYYVLLRKEGPARSESALGRLRAVGLGERTDLDEAFWRDVARPKVLIPSAALGDCFALALARRVGAAVVTADRPGFLPARNIDVCPVVLIR